MKLSEIRKEKGYSQEEVAKKINISQSNYSKYELGKIEPNIELLTKLSDFFHVSIDYLLDHQIYNKPAGEYYQLTEEQKKLFPIIKQLNSENIGKTEAYINGLLDGQLQHEDKIKKIIK